MIERESLGGPLEDRPFLVSAMVEDSNVRSGMGIGIWEALLSESQNEEEWALGGEESSIWEEFLIDIGTDGFGEFDEVDNLSDPSFHERLADPSETGPTVSHRDKDLPPEIDGTDAGLTEEILDGFGIWEQEDPLGEEAAPKSAWSPRDEPVSSGSGKIGSTREKNEAAPGHFLQNEGESPDMVGNRRSRMTWVGGGLAILLALTVGFFLLREYFPTIGLDYDKGDVGLIEGQPKGAEHDRTFVTSEQSIPLAKGPAVSSEETEVNLGRSDRGAQVGPSGKSLLTSRKEVRSTESEEQAAEGRGHQGSETGGDGEERRVYSVHVGSFKMRNNADRLVERLARIGYNAREEFISLPQKGSWYRVLVGTFNTREDANALSVQLKDEEALPALVLEGKAY